MITTTRYIGSASQRAVAAVTGIGKKIYSVTLTWLKCRNWLIKDSGERKRRKEWMNEWMDAVNLMHSGTHKPSWRGDGFSSSSQARPRCCCASFDRCLLSGVSVALPEVRVS